MNLRWSLWIAAGLSAGLAALFLLLRPHAAPEPPLLLAAASLQEAMEEAADAWSARGHARPRLSFAGTSALARQIAAGAPADLFAAADEAWMDDLEARSLLAAGTRAPLLGNRLVLVAPRDSSVRVDPAPGAPIVAALGGGRLAIAEPEAVPAGRYGKAALKALGLWNAVKDRLARAENVRAALALVERGAAPLGIVYATDAAASRQVRVVGVFPEASHPPIRYPLARLRTSDKAEAEAFRRFLHSPEARAIFARRGFEAP